MLLSQCSSNLIIALLSLLLMLLGCVNALPALTTQNPPFEYAPPTSNEQSAFDTARLSTETLVASSSSAGDLTPLESMPPPALARVEPDDQKTERIEPVRVAQELEVMDQPSPPAPPPFTDAAPSSISDGDLYRELIMPVSEDTEMSRLFQMGVSKFDENPAVEGPK